MSSNFSNKLYNLFKFFQKTYKENQNFDYPVAHDPCTIYYLLYPNNLNGRDCYV
jgi:inosine-uridine nucleoside N-ribohydrolase